MVLLILIIGRILGFSSVYVRCWRWGVCRITFTQHDDLGVGKAVINAVVLGSDRIQKSQRRLWVLDPSSTPTQISVRFDILQQNPDATHDVDFGYSKADVKEAADQKRIGED